MKTKRPVEAVTGRYTPLPHTLLDSVAFQGAQPLTRLLIFELARQHDGKNNGHMHLSVNWLKKRGWSSNNSIQRCKKEALERGLIVKTREGGLNIGPDRYALTWLAITNFVSLQIEPKDYHPGKYLFMDKLVPPPVPKPAVKRDDRIYMREKRDEHTHGGCGTVPLTGAPTARTVPVTGARTAIFDPPTAPVTGNNECYQYPPAKLRRVVGAPGRSGKRKTEPATAKEMQR